MAWRGSTTIIRPIPSPHHKRHGIRVNKQERIHIAIHIRAVGRHPQQQLGKLSFQSCPPMFIRNTRYDDTVRRLYAVSVSLLTTASLRWDGRYVYVLYTGEVS